MTLFATALLSLSIISSDALLVEPQPLINPTGTYRLSERRSKRRGEMRVTMTDATHIAVRLVVSSGAPAFQTGLLVDTIEYANNTAMYFDPNNEASCTITFLFSRTGTRIEEHHHDNCTFGNGITLAGTYRRVNRKPRTL